MRTTRAENSFMGIVERCRESKSVLWGRTALWGIVGRRGGVVCCVWECCRHMGRCIALCCVVLDLCVALLLDVYCVMLCVYRALYCVFCGALCRTLWWGAGHNGACCGVTWTYGTHCMPPQSPTPWFHWLRCTTTSSLTEVTTLHGRDHVKRTETL